MGKVIISGKVPKLVKPLPAVGTALNDFTWEQIRQISDAGLAANYFSVGDTKNITLNGSSIPSNNGVGTNEYFITLSNVSIDVFIIGIDHNSTVEGTNRIHFQIGKINNKDVMICQPGKGLQMNTTATNVGGWASSYGRTTVLGSDGDPANPTSDTLLAALPSDLRAVMKPVTKYTDNTGGGSNVASYVTATEDYLPCLSEFEIFGTQAYANSAERNYQKQYDYYKAGNSKVRYVYSKVLDGSATEGNGWYSRSPTNNYNNSFSYVQYNGVCGSSYAHSNAYWGMSPLFCV